MAAAITTSNASRHRAEPSGPQRVPARSTAEPWRGGLRAQDFALLPEEDPEAWRALVLALRAAYRPRDAAEAVYVDAIAVAIWRERRADRLEAEAMADIAPAEEGRGCGSDLGSAAARASLATVIRYRRAAQLEHRRALALLKEHRRLRGPSSQRTAADADGTEARAGSAACEEDGREPTALAADRNEMLAASAARGVRSPEPAVARGPAARSEDAGERPPSPAPDLPPEPVRVELRAAERARLNPLDTPLLRALGRDPDLVLPVPGIEPRLWPKAQERAASGPFPPDGPQPYRRVPGLPWDLWWSHQHLLTRGSAADGAGAERERRAA